MSSLTAGPVPPKTTTPTAQAATPPPRTIYIIGDRKDAQGIDEVTGVVVRSDLKDKLGSFSLVIRSAPHPDASIKAINEAPPLAAFLYAADSGKISLKKISETGGYVVAIQSDCDVAQALMVGVSDLVIREEALPIKDLAARVRDEIIRLMEVWRHQS